MPRYHFDVRADDILVQDEDGREVPDIGAVEAEAAEAAVAIGCDEFSAFSANGGSGTVAVEVRDEHGNRVVTATATMSLRIERADRRAAE